MRKNDAENNTHKSCSSFDSNVFYIDDELVVPQPENFEKSNTDIDDQSNIKAHFDCQNTLKNLRQIMEIKDDEISKSLNFGWALTDIVISKNANFLISFNACFIF